MKLFGSFRLILALAGLTLLVPSYSSRADASTPTAAQAGPAATAPPASASGPAAPGSPAASKANAPAPPPATATVSSAGQPDKPKPVKISRRPYLWALGTLVLLYLLFGFFAKLWNPLKVCVGADGRLSTSKLQFFLWTVVALFAYVSLYAAWAEAGLTLSSLTKVGIPQNLFLAMGLSITTMAAAKGITVAYVASGKVQKPPTKAGLRLGDAFQDDSGYGDLTKIQMMSWTLVAIIVYLRGVHAWIAAPPSDFQLPDIDVALMALMGLGQGAYVWKKSVTTDTPHVNAASVDARGSATRNLRITGTSFGATQDQSKVTLDGVPVPVTGATWTDTAVTLPLPVNPNGTSWPVDNSPALVVQVGILAGSQESNRVPVTL